MRNFSERRTFREYVPFGTMTAAKVTRLGICDSVTISKTADLNNSEGVDNRGKFCQLKTSITLVLTGSSPTGRIHPQSGQINYSPSSGSWTIR
jgi:hypothetical protein